MLKTRLMRYLKRGGLVYAGVCIVVFFIQRSLLFFPSHETPTSKLSPWKADGDVIGFCRTSASPETVWLMMHGNAGQAAHRDYVLPRLSEDDALYVLEYPGYGARTGSPSKQAFDQAAAEAYRHLRTQYPNTPIGVIGESIGSGPASTLANEATPPDKIVLITPFDELASVAASRMVFLPVRLLLRDRWNNIKELKSFKGDLEIYGARSDEVIPIEHARRLATQLPGAELIEISSGHNDWSTVDQVQIKR